jgi:hypothetical protein
LYGSENWTIKANYKTRITAAELRFVGITAKYIWRDYKRNDEILKELNIEPVMGKILKHKNSWIQHVNRMQGDRIPKLLKLQTVGKEKQRMNKEETLGRRGRNGSMNGLTP